MRYKSLPAILLLVSTSVAKTSTLANISKERYSQQNIEHKHKRKTKKVYLEKEIFEKLKLKYLNYLKNLEIELKTKEQKLAEKEQKYIEEINRLKKELERTQMICEKEINLYKSKVISLQRSYESKINALIKMRSKKQEEREEQNTNQTQKQALELLKQTLKNLLKGASGVVCKGNSCVILNGDKVIKEGDTLASLKIKKITRSYIEFEGGIKIDFKDILN